MLRNYFKIAWRNLWNNKVYTAINSLGLAIGLSVFLLVLLYINYEKSYDKWDRRLENVYRVGVAEKSWGENGSSPTVQYPLGTYLAAECPEVNMISRVWANSGESLLSSGKNEFFNRKVIAADSNFFAVFPYRFLYGNPKNALNKPSAIVITKAISERLFGNEDPVGKIIKIDNATDYTVTGVIEKPGPSHLDFDLCASNNSTYFASNWFMKNQDTYLVLKPGSSLPAIQKRAEDVYRHHATTEGKDSASVFFEPVSAIHLKPRGQNEGETPENKPVYDFNRGNDLPLIIFSVIGLCVLLLACINYTNMAVALAGKRAKESGLRKVMGSSRKQLIIQFLAEALIQTVAAAFLALIMVLISRNILNDTFRLSLSLWSTINSQQNIQLLLQVVIIVAAVAIVAGAYPAFLLSGYAPVKVLKGDITRNVKGRNLRNGLVILQYSIATCFILSMMIISLQISFMRNNDPGFKTDQVLRIKLGPHSPKLLPGHPDDRSGYISESLMKIPGIQAVSMSNSYPGQSHVVWQEANFGGDKDTLSMSFNFINFGYLDLLNLHIIKGRDFSKQFARDSVDAAVINETAAMKLGWKEPLNKKLNIVGRDYSIVGVIKDSHLMGYTSKTPPEIYVVGVDSRNFAGHSNILLRVDGTHAGEVLSKITAFWKTVVPDYPIRYTWLNDDFAKLMEKYERFGKLAGLLTVAAIAIAVMGIFALSAYTAQQRTREIGIRKVLGASVSGIVKMLSSDFVKLVLIAVIIASPVSWWAMNRWLQNFAYRIEIQWWMFALAGILAMLIAFVTVSFQAVKSALMNPVKSLRSE